MPLTEVRRSRRFRLCESCRRGIEPGQRYRRMALPPWRDVNSSDHFWTLAAHIEGECVR